MQRFAIFDEIWLWDFEFYAPAGERPIPLCLVARELRSGRLVRVWLGDKVPSVPPFRTDKRTLFMAFYASAELGCHLSLGWSLPLRVVDLYVEFRNITCGLPVPCGNGLVGALTYYGLDAIDAGEKEAMRQLAMRGGEYTEEERIALLDYCQSDVDSLARLLLAMLPDIDLPRAIYRARYMSAVARMEAMGVPMDSGTLFRLRQHWDSIRAGLVRQLNEGYGVYVPTCRRPIDPQSLLGEAVLAAAKECEVDPHDLMETLNVLHKQEREANRDRIETIRGARKRSGQTVNRIDQLINQGKDYLDVPGLDIAARELSGEFPTLGIGQGYRREGGYDTGLPRLLWELLSEPEPATRPKYDPELIRRAVEQVQQSGPTEYVGLWTFSEARFRDYLSRARIPWPVRKDGGLSLDDKTFKEMARTYPEQIGPLREVRHALSQLRLNELAVGKDGRNRVLLSPFCSRTSRNQPSNSRFIFGPSCWLRSLIRPGEGRAIAYIDWSQQELAIAAALSGDKAMQECYRAGDFYLTFAKMAGAIPQTATKQTHAAEREQFKVVALGVLYGLAAEGLARKLGVPTCKGRELLQLHRETFREFWRWSDAVEAQAVLSGRLRTMFGWAVRVGQDANPRSLRNFPMQANGAEMMRLACCLATERGIEVNCPVHDALLVEGAIDDIENVVGETQKAMREASEVILPGFPLRTDAKIVKHPDRFSDPRGVKMWSDVMALLARVEKEEIEKQKRRLVGGVGP